MRFFKTQAANWFFYEDFNIYLSWAGFILCYVRVRVLVRMSVLWVEGRKEGSSIYNRYLFETHSFDGWTQCSNTDLKRTRLSCFDTHDQ